MVGNNFSSNWNSCSNNGSARESQNDHFYQTHRLKARRMELPLWYLCDCWKLTGFLLKTRSGEQAYSVSLFASGTLLLALCSLFTQYGCIEYTYTSSLDLKSIPADATSYTYTSSLDLKSIPADATSVTFRDFPLPTIPSNAFPNLSNCNSITIANTETSSIEPDAFNGLRSATELVF